MAPHSKDLSVDNVVMGNLFLSFVLLLDFLVLVLDFMLSRTTSFGFDPICWFSRKACLYGNEVITAADSIFHFLVLGFEILGRGDSDCKTSASPG